MNITDLCQGHGGGRDCAYDPDFGCLEHTDDCGVTSYCDGTCQSARDAWLDELDLHPWMMPVGSATTITLDVRGYGRAPASYRVVFTGPDAQARALAYIAPRRGYYFTEAQDAPFHGPAFPALYAALYPVCHHGLSLDLCMDPIGDAHFGTREQELAMGW